MKGAICFIRNSDIKFDTRQRKSAEVANDCNYKVISLNWNRVSENFGPRSEKIAIGNNYIEALYYNRISEFGGGFRNVFNLIAYNFWVFFTLYKLKKSINIVHACDLDVAIPAVLYCKIFKKKFVYDIYDFYSHTHSMPSAIKKCVYFLEIIVSKCANVVIVCTDKRKEMIEMHGVKKNKVLVIFNTPNLGNLDRSCILKTEKKTNFKICYVGTLPPTGRLLVEVLELCSTMPNVELHIAGIGPLADHINNMSKLHSNIKWYGQLTNSEALSLQASCDMLFATYDPSIDINKYAAPNKVYEAMALSKPVIVCKGTDPEDIIENNKCGTAINYEIKEFEMVVMKYDANRGLAQAEGVRGYHEYCNKYSWDMVAKTHRKAYI